MTEQTDAPDWTLDTAANGYGGMTIRDGGRHLATVYFAAVGTGLADPAADPLNLEAVLAGRKMAAADRMHRALQQVQTFLLDFEDPYAEDGKGDIHRAVDDVLALVPDPPGVAATGDANPASDGSPEA